MRATLLIGSAYDAVTYAAVAITVRHAKGAANQLGITAKEEFHQLAVVRVTSKLCHLLGSTGRPSDQHPVEAFGADRRVRRVIRHALIDDELSGGCSCIGQPHFLRQLPDVAL